MADPEPKSLKEDMVAPLASLTIDTSQHASKSSSTNNNNINNNNNKGLKKKPKKSKAVADSWEDEDLSSSGDENDGEAQADKTEPGSEDLSTPSGTSSRRAVPSPPPPTPISAITGGAPREYPGGSVGSGSAPAERERRPEKTDAVARRMIAAGLGLKAPKQTEEQKAYQRSVREQEKKKREQERAEEQKRKEEAERAKAAIWGD